MALLVRNIHSALDILEMELADLVTSVLKHTHLLSFRNGEIGLSKNKQEAQKNREDGKSKGYQYLEAIVKKMINADNTKQLVS